MKNRCDILEFCYSSRGRDVDIVEPVISYLELKYGLKIIRKWCFGNVAFNILRYNPKMVVIANGVGSNEHFHVVKFASKLGIKVVTLTSEGDYVETEEGTKDFFWGWNKDNKVYEDLHLEWTERNLKLINKYIPQSRKFDIKVSGATGFDRYKFWHFMKIDDFLRKYKKERYRKIIGLVGFAFDFFSGEYYERFKEYVDNRYGEEDVRFHLKAREALREIYEKMIKNNPEILFIIKYHPLTTNEELTEFMQLDKYENVVKIVVEENIADIINVCDFLVAYESTSCLEAWLMGKQTMLINPLGGDFKRSSIAKGSPTKTTYTEVEATVERFYQVGILDGFKEKEEIRKQVIKDVIQWEDGKNHIRAAEYINESFLKKNDKKYSLDWKTVMEIAKIQKNLLVSTINNFKVNKTDKKPKKYINKEREEFHQKYLKYLREFYIKNDIQL